MGFYIFDIDLDLDRMAWVLELEMDGKIVAKCEAPFLTHQVEIEENDTRKRWRIHYFPKVGAAPDHLA